MGAEVVHLDQVIAGLRVLGREALRPVACGHIVEKRLSVRTLPMRK